MKKLPPLWTMFTDATNTAWSWSRVMCTIIIAAALAWGSHVVYHEKKIPDFSTVAILIGAIYGISRGSEAYENRFPKPPEPPQPPPPLPGTI
jgi:hypothetical protein